MRCVYCGEEYDLGPDGGIEGMRYFPEGERMYWKHVRESKRHQAGLSMQALLVHEQLDHLQVILKKAKAAKAKQKREEKKRAKTQQD